MSVEGLCAYRHGSHGCSNQKYKQLRALVCTVAHGPGDGDVTSESVAAHGHVDLWRPRTH